MLRSAIRFTGFLIAIAGLAGVAANAAHAQTGSDNMSRIENGLTSSNLSITSRMATHKMTGMSLVIVEGNAIRWRRGYGLRRATDPASSVTSTSLFDAASVSKPVAAAAALRLVEQGRVSLTDVRILEKVAPKYLTQLQTTVFLRQFDRPADIDLARLLMHCAGALADHQVDSLTLTGAQPFSLSSTLPTMGQQLLGSSPAGATYKPVQTSALRPGVRYQYSGASYLLVQAVIDRYAPNGFGGYTNDLFKDLGMTQSTFVGAPAIRVTSLYGSKVFAMGHEGGKMQAARNYANHAAAGLVTTTEDLARFLIMVNQNGMYGGKRVLALRTMDMLTGRHTNTNDRCANRTISARAGSMTAGLRRNNTGTLHHRGTHNGYRAYIFARPGNSWAMAVIMTGAPDDANRFAAELFRAVEKVYDFPDLTLVQ